MNSIDIIARDVIPKNHTKSKVQTIFEGVTLVSMEKRRT